MSDASDRKALLSTLSIDRNAPAEGAGRPLKWFALIAILSGIGFVTWYFDPIGGGEGVVINTAVASSASNADISGSVLDATGYVVARRQATVSSKTTGKVVDVLIEEGDAVTEGQLLATLDDRIPRAQLALSESRLQSARAALREIQVQIKQAQLDLERTKGLASRNLASKADLDRDGLDVEALAARLNRAGKEILVAERSLEVQRELLDDMQIRAPFAGIVVAKSAQPGEMISPVSAGGGFTRTGICTIVDMESLEVEVDVNEAYINRVYPKQPVTVALNAYPDVKLAAEVIAIIPAADRNKATVRVRVGFLKRDDRVLPDMGVKVAFLDGSVQSAPVETPVGVLVPRGSVGSEANVSFVWVIDGSQAQRRTVVVGERHGSRVQVISGLEHGERVVAALSEALLASLTDGVPVDVVN